MEKNKVQDSTISVGGNLRIGDNIYNIGTEKASLFPLKKYLEILNVRAIPTDVRGLSKTQEKIISFFASTDQLLIISGEAETGKTYLINSIVSRVPGYFEDALGYLPMYEDQVELIKELATYLPKDKKLLLVFDDLTWYTEGLSPLLRILPTAPNVKVIICTKPVGKEAIYQCLRQERNLSTKIWEIHLQEWKNKELITLLRAVTGQETVKHEREITKYFASPNLIIEYGARLIGASQGDLVNLQKKVTRSIINDCQIIDKETKVGDTYGILIELALFCPIPGHKLKQVLAIVSNRRGMPVQGIEGVLDKLLQQKLLHYSHYFIQFKSKINGALLIANWLEEGSLEDVLSLLSFYVEHEEYTILNNLYPSLDFTQNQNFINHFFKQLLLSWQKEVKTTGGLTRSRRIKAVTSFLKYPELRSDIVDLVVEYVDDENSPVEENSSTQEYYLGDPPPNLNVFSPFILELTEYPEERGRSLFIIQELHKKGFSSVASNHKPLYLLSEALKFYRNNEDSYNVCFEFLDEWINEEDDLLIPLIEQFLKEVLSISQSFNYTEFSTYTTGYYHVPPEKSLIEYRDKAIKRLNQLIADDRAAQIAFRVIQDIGVGKPFLTMEKVKDAPLFERLKEEIESLTKLLGGILLNTENLQLQAEAESILLDWWLQGLCEEASTYLHQFERKPEYLCFRYCSTHRIYTEDFKKLQAAAPASERWEWYWDKEDEIKKDTQNLMREKSIAANLNLRYNSSSKVLKFIEIMIEELKPEEASNNFPLHKFCIIVANWVILSPKIFRGIIKSDDIAVQLPRILRGAIEDTLVEQGEMDLAEFFQSVILQLPNPDYYYLDSFLRTLQRKKPIEKETWITQLIERGSERVNDAIASRLKWIFPEKKEARIIIKLLILALEKGKIDFQRFFSTDGAGFAYDHLKEHEASLPKQMLEGLRKETVEKLKFIPVLNSDLNHALSFCMTNLTEVISFFSFRLSYFDPEKQKKPGGYYSRLPRVFPSNYYRISWCRLIHDLEDYKELIDAVIGWKEQFRYLRGGIGFEEFVRHFRNCKAKNEALYINTLVEHSRKANNYEASLKYAAFLPNVEENYPLLITVWDSALKNVDKTEVVKAIFNWQHKGGLRIGWMTSPYNQDKIVLEKLLDKTKSTQVRLQKILKTLHREAEEMARRLDEDSI